MNLNYPTKKNVLSILIIITITLVCSSIFSIWVSKYTHLEIPSLVTIKSIGVEAFWDIDLKNKIESIEWDILRLGSSQNVTFYIKSMSNVETVLQLDISDWNPPNISKFLELSWNYTYKPIKPREVIKITLTLSCSSSLPFSLAREYILEKKIETFTFNIIIHAKEIY